MSFKKYFKCRSVESLIEEAKKSRALARSFGPFQLLMLGIGAIIGAGIFAFTGTAAALHAGPAMAISFILAGLACACAALCYAELASMIPISGSSYTYAYTTLGELPAWIIAGMIMLTYILGSAAVASAWSGYTISFLKDYDIFLPPVLSANTGKLITTMSGEKIYSLVNLPAVLISILLTMVVYRGAETSAIVNTIIVFIKMTVIFAFIALGATKVDPNNWVPFIPENTGKFGEFGYSGIIAGAAVVFLAYTGFDAVATAAQETKNPKRDLPIGIIGSLVICTIVYVAVSLVLTGLANYKDLNVAEPMAVAVNSMNMPWFATVIKVGAISGLTSVILVLIYGAVRILFTVTHDGLLPAAFAKTNKKYHTPHLLTWTVGATIAILSTTVHVDILVKIANFGTLITFTIVCIGTIYLRYKKPDVPREFRCPLVPVIPGIGIILFVIILAGLPSDVFIYAGIWAVFVTAIYFLYGRHNSHLLHPHKKKH